MAIPLRQSSPFRISRVSPPWARSADEIALRLIGVVKHDDVADLRRPEFGDAVVGEGDAQTVDVAHDQDPVARHERRLHRTVGS